MIKIISIIFLKRHILLVASSELVAAVHTGYNWRAGSQVTITQTTPTTNSNKKKRERREDR